MVLIEITKAPQAYRLLNGVVCLFKDRFIDSAGLSYNFRSKLAEDLNKYEPRPIRERVVIEGSTGDDQLQVKKEISYADHPLVVGPRYKANDIKLSIVNEIDYNASGLVVAGIGSEGVHLAKILAESNFVRSFEVKCKFGRSTDNCFDFGRTIEKSTFKHIRKSRMDFVLSKIVSIQRKMIFKSAGVDMQSQDAYELAASGPTRPISDRGVPLLYNLKCTHFKSPEFILQLQVINEDIWFIAELVNGIGIKNRSNACMTSLRCTRYGHFTIENSLLEKDFTVEGVLNNIASNIDLTAEEKLRPLHPNLHSPSVATKENLMKIIRENKDKFSIVDKPVSLKG